MAGLVADGFVDELRQADAAFDRIIKDKVQFGRDPQADPAGYLPADEAGRAVQGGCTVFPGLFVPQHADVDMRVRQVPRCPDFQDRHQGRQAGILDFILDYVGDDPLDFIADPV
jgi:hypothetical protein